jgi:type 1 glutamine amidotransferase
LAISQGTVLAESLGWPGHDPTGDFAEVKKREPYMTRLEAVPWAAMLVSEQTRQFCAYKDIAERFLPHLFGAFRMTLEEHQPLTLINDWDINAQTLKRFAVLILPNAASLSDAQAAAIREFVRAGGGLVATCETSLCDDLGRPRNDFALADVFGVSYRGRPKAPLVRPKLDENFAVALDETYWKQRTGVVTLSWTDHPLARDAKLSQLVPKQSVIARGPLVAVTEPVKPDEAVIRMKPEGTGKSLPAGIARTFGKGRVVYLAAGLDAALWSYAYPYQRRLLARAVEWAAREPAPIAVTAPMCVQATCFTQVTVAGKRLVVHLFNGVNTAANHGLPAQEVPLREEVIPVHGIRVTIRKDAPARFRCEPGARPVEVQKDGDAVTVTCPSLDIHMVLVGEYT